MKISIVIPTHERVTSLLRLLTSIQEQGFDPDQVETIVASNIDEDYFRSPEFKTWQSQMNLKHFVVGYRGVNKARNLGIKKTQGEIVYLLDDDCVLHNKNHLDKIYQAHQAFPEALAIGGTYIHGPHSSLVDRAYNFITYQWQFPQFYGEIESDRLVGGNVSYKRLQLLSSGQWLNESIHYGGTESEFHQRLKKAGHQLLLLQNLEVCHDSQLEIEQIISKAFYQAHGRLQWGETESYECRSSHQSPKYSLALKSCTEKQEFADLKKAMDAYDLSYQYTTENSSLPIEKVKKQVLKSLRSGRSL